MQNSNYSIEGRVFVVTYGGGHAAAMAPIVSGLVSRSVKFNVLALTTAKSYFDRQGLISWSMASVAENVTGYRGVRRVGRLLAREGLQHSAVSQDDTEAYLGVGFHAMARALGLRRARALYQERGRQSFRPVDFFRTWFSQQRPAVVVATSAPRSERAALEAARDLGIPSVCVVDLYAPFEIEWCASPEYASKICVLNEAVAQRFMDRGVPAGRVVVTGNPAFDRLSKLDVDRIRRGARRAMGVADDELVVSWMSQPEPTRHPFSGAGGNSLLPELIERYLIQGVAERPKVKLVLRRHPSEDRPRTFTESSAIYSDSSQSLDDLLCASDCIVTCSSTVGLEAAILGVPVVQSMDSIFSIDLPLGDLGLAIAVDEHVLLWPVIDDVLCNLPRHKSLGRTSHAISSAGARIAEIISQLIK